MGVSIPLPADCEPTALPSELIPQQTVPLRCSQVAIEVPKTVGTVHLYLPQPRGAVVDIPVGVRLVPAVPD